MLSRGTWDGVRPAAGKETGPSQASGTCRSQNGSCSSLLRSPGWRWSSASLHLLGNQAESLEKITITSSLSGGFSTLWLFFVSLALSPSIWRAHPSRLTRRCGLSSASNVTPDSPARRALTHPSRDLTRPPRSPMTAFGGACRGMAAAPGPGTRGESG